MARPLKIARNTLALVSLALATLLLNSAATGAQIHLGPGDRAVVFGVGPLGLAVREGPGFHFPVLEVLPLETEVDVVDGPAWSGSVPWYLISGYDGNGGRGWAAGTYLQPQEEAPASEEAEPPTGEEGAPAERTPSARGSATDGRSFIALVTAYAINGRTASGEPTRWGIVAVDPSVIPIGSRIQIDGFEEEFLAADTGGAVKGNWVDIWFPSYAEAYQFGTQARRVTIVEP